MLKLGLMCEKSFWKTSDFPFVPQKRVMVTSVGYCLFDGTVDEAVVALGKFVDGTSMMKITLISSQELDNDVEYTEPDYSKLEKNKYGLIPIRSSWIVMDEIEGGNWIVMDEIEGGNEK